MNATFYAPSVEATAILVNGVLQMGTKLPLFPSAVDTDGRTRHSHGFSGIHNVIHFTLLIEISN